MAHFVSAELIGGHLDQFVIVVGKDSITEEPRLLKRWEGGRYDRIVVLSNNHTADAIATAINDAEERGRNEIRRKLRELTFVSDEE